MKQSKGCVRTWDRDRTVCDGCVKACSTHWQNSSSISVERLTFWMDVGKWPWCMAAK